MTAALRLHQDGSLLTGRVVAREAECCAIALEHHGGPAIAREVRATRAASCLLAPEPGDRVLLALTPEPFVLAVLERGEHDAELHLTGDATLRTSGKLSIEASGGIDLTTPARLSLTSRALQLCAHEGDLVFKRLSAVARRASASFDSAVLLAQACDLMAERLSSRLRRVYRTVEESEQLRARHIDYRAAETAQLKGETTVVTARQVARIDGSQVLIG